MAPNVSATSISKLKYANISKVPSVSKTKKNAKPVILTNNRSRFKNHAKKNKSFYPIKKATYQLDRLKPGRFDLYIS